MTVKPGNFPRFFPGSYDGKSREFLLTEHIRWVRDRQLRSLAELGAEERRVMREYANGQGRPEYPETMDAWLADVILP